MNHAKIVEVVLFRPAPDVGETDVLTTANLMQAKVRQMRGFIDRQLLKNGEGQWVDLVWWEDMAHAQAASDAIMQDAELAPYMGMFAEGEMTIMHLEPAALR